MLLFTSHENGASPNAESMHASWPGNRVRRRLAFVHCDATFRGVERRNPAPGARNRRRGSCIPGRNRRNDHRERRRDRQSRFHRGQRCGGGDRHRWERTPRAPVAGRDQADHRQAGPVRDQHTRPSRSHFRKRGVRRGDICRSQKPAARPRRTRSVLSRYVSADVGRRIDDGCENHSTDAARG